MPGTLFDGLQILLGRQIQLKAVNAGAESRFCLYGPLKAQLS